MIASTQTNHPLPGGEAARQPKDRLDTACAHLRASGLRITQPRIAILKTLIERGTPISIEQIHAELQNKSCDLVTVYRCLAAFENIGLVRRAFFHNGTSLYEMSDSQQIAYHVVAKDTGVISALDAASSAELSAAIAKIEATLKQQGFSEVSHIVEFFAKGSTSSAPVRSLNVEVTAPEPV